jgi:AhpD family alkylhydroperoxidase
MRMQERLPYGKIAPGELTAMYGLTTYARESGLESGLLELVKLRASQINGCAFCANMHAHDARSQGETNQRLDCLAVWREAPFYTDRERAALAWTEAITLVSTTGVPDDVYEQARTQFGEKELVDLTLAIVAINGWNRFSVSFRIMPHPDHPSKA